MGTTILANRTYSQMDIMSVTSAKRFCSETKNNKTKTTMKAKFKNGKLVLYVPMLKEPEVSESGKFMMFAKTDRFEKLDLEYKGKKIAVSVCAGVSTKK